MDQIWVPKNVHLIDHWLATRVMGWKYCDRMFCYHWGETLKDSISKTEWKPSTDLIQCKMIWDALMARGYAFEIRNVRSMRIGVPNSYSAKVYPAERKGNENIYPLSQTYYHETLEGALCSLFVRMFNIASIDETKFLLAKAIEHKGQKTWDTNPQT